MNAHQRFIFLEEISTPRIKSADGDPFDTLHHPAPPLPPEVQARRDKAYFRSVGPRGAGPGIWDSLKQLAQSGKDTAQRGWDTTKRTAQGGWDSAGKGLKNVGGHISSMAGDAGKWIGKNPGTSAALGGTALAGLLALTHAHGARRARRQYEEEEE